MQLFLIACLSHRSSAPLFLLRDFLGFVNLNHSVIHASRKEFDRLIDTLICVTLGSTARFFRVSSLSGGCVLIVFVYVSLIFYNNDLKITINRPFINSRHLQKMEIMNRRRSIWKRKWQYGSLGSLENSSYADCSPRWLILQAYSWYRQPECRSVATKQTKPKESKERLR